MRFALVIAVAAVLVSSAAATGPFSTKTLAGSGVNPPCAHRLSWSVIGAFFGSTFTGKVKIKLASGQTAISSISLTRD